MKSADFDKLKYFSIAEKNHRGEFIFKPEILKNTDFKTMLFLDGLREVIASPIIIHCTYEPGGHTQSSQHYKKPSTAVDFHFDTNLPYLEQIKILLAFIEFKDLERLTGVGIYPDWKNPGFHFDIRGSFARWGAMFTNKQEYFDFDYVLKKIMNSEKYNGLR